jgi:hypothetical protein
MKKLIRSARWLAVAFALLLVFGGAGTAWAEEEATESQEAPAVESAPPESAPDSDEEKTASDEEEEGSQTEDEGSQE